MSKRDLFVVVADLDAENAISTLLRDRQQSLGIRLDFNPDRPPEGDLMRYAKRDSGCYKDAVNLLRTPQRTHNHAMLLFDRHGCGADDKPRTEIEPKIEKQLVANGWPAGTVSVVVIEPELEAWVWATSPWVADVLGWHRERRRLRPFLAQEGLWDNDAPKPNDPKMAMERALQEQQKPLGARLFSDLAARVRINQCQDPAFAKLRQTLQQWFPA